MILEVAALTLAGTHFGVPLLYYYYLKSRYLNKPWSIKVDENYKPKVTVIVPTYMEAELIQGKLRNLYAQEYPKDLMEIIVIDSGSTDGTAELVEGWASKHKGVNLKLIREAERRGKAYALNHALKYAIGEVVVTADVDALWPNRALAEALKWFADPTVGAVSCLKKPIGSKIRGVEGDYRRYYNVLRVAESKAYATPIFHGELAVFRRSLLELLGGFPTDIGADDSHTATRIALLGYRAIVPEDLWVEEFVPNEGYFLWRARRAQHLIQHFVKTIKEARKHKVAKEFRKIIAVEFFLHVVNPWLLLTSILILLVSMVVFSSLLAALVMILGLTLLSLKRYRTWIAQQLFLIVAALRNLKSKEIAWSK